jgi:hypothetical protein
MAPGVNSDCFSVLAFFHAATERLLPIEQEDNGTRTPRECIEVILDVLKTFFNVGDLSSVNVRLKRLAVNILDLCRSVIEWNIGWADSLVRRSCVLIEVDGDANLLAFLQLECRAHKLKTRMFFGDSIFALGDFMCEGHVNPVLTTIPVQVVKAQNLFNRGLLHSKPHTSVPSIGPALRFRIIRAAQVVLRSYGDNSKVLPTSFPGRRWYLLTADKSNLAMSMLYGLTVGFILQLVQGSEGVGLHADEARDSQTDGISVIHFGQYSLWHNPLRVSYQTFRDTPNTLPLFLLLR